MGVLNAVMVCHVFRGKTTKPWLGSSSMMHRHMKSVYTMCGRVFASVVEQNLRHVQ